jgi:hypothetical protein
MKLTLLQMVQDILNDMDSDSVNSIDDTEESLQVAQIVKTTYFNLTSQRDWSFLRAKDNLTGLGDTSNPTKMQIPTDFDKVIWVKYNQLDVCWLSPKEFQDILDERDEDEDNVLTGGFRNDKAPQWWTSFDDNFIFFDSHDVDVDTTLQESKAVFYGTIIPTWTASDAFVPTLPAKMFPTLLAGAKATAFSTLKQVANASAESFAGRGVVRAQNEQWRVKDAEARPNKRSYGRK